jgi:hypothetical protein
MTDDAKASSRAQIEKLLEKLASTGVAWLVGRHAEPMVKGSVWLADDGAVAAIRAQSVLKQAPPEQDLTLEGKAWRVFTTHFGDGWALGAVVEAELDPATMRGRMEKAAAFLEKAIQV